MIPRVGMSCQMIRNPTMPAVPSSALRSVRRERGARGRAASVGASVVIGVIRSVGRNDG